MATTHKRGERCCAAYDPPLKGALIDDGPVIARAMVRELNQRLAVRRAATRTAR